MDRKILLILVFILLMHNLFAKNEISQSSAKWIGCISRFDDTTEFSSAPARYLRKTVVLKGKVKKATMYICGLGLYDAWINGEHITCSQVLSPTPSDYRKRVYYNQFDVTAAMKKKTAIGVILGNGRFFALRMVSHNPKAPFVNFGIPRLWLKIDLLYSDGQKDSIISDETWRISDNGPIRSNNEYDGEFYDANKEFANWSKFKFDDSSWENAEILPEPGGILVPQINENITINERIRPISISLDKNGSYILDVGQNISGWLQVSAKGIQKGDTLKLRFAELLNSDGSINRASLHDAKETDYYISRSKKRFIWHPIFTPHGFRYVEISGLRKKAKLSDFEAQVIYDKMDITGQFECSDSVINKINKCGFRTIRNNYRGMPLDCPQRSERMPYLGDRGELCYGESYIFNNHDFYSKWLTDIEDSQCANGHIPNVAPRFRDVDSANVSWCGVFISVADMLLRRFGDVQPIKDHYCAMKKWLNFMEDNYLKNGIMTKDRYGDWGAVSKKINVSYGNDSTKSTSGEFISTSIYYYLLQKMQEFAELSGHSEDASAYKIRENETYNAFNRQFLNTEYGYYDNNSATSNLMALFFKLVPKDYEKLVLHNLVNEIVHENDSHFLGGFVGMMFLFRTLTEYGYEDLAIKILRNKSYPGLGHMIDNGATTIWEFWDALSNAGASRDHVALLGDFIVWEYEYLAGIRPGKPGYLEIELKPYPTKELKYVNCTFNSVKGKIVSNWTLKGDKFEWDIEIPHGTCAKAYIPTHGGKRRLQDLSSGKHHIISTL